MIRYSCLSISKSAPFETMFGAIPWRKNAYESATKISNHIFFKVSTENCTILVPILADEIET